MTSSDNNNKIIIIGGGIGGLSLSLLLQKANIHSEVFESYPEDSVLQASTAGGLQLAPNGMKVLRILGLDEEVIKNGSATNGMIFYNDSGVVVSSVENQKIEDWGIPAVNLARFSLHNILLSECKKRKIIVNFGKRFSGFVEEKDQVIVKFTDGTSVIGRILIGSDGVHSVVRAALDPNGPKPEYTGLSSLGGFIPKSCVPALKEMDHQKLHMTFGPIGFFGYGPCQDRLMWWSTFPLPTGKEHLNQLSISELKELLLEYHGKWHGPIPEIVKHALDYDFLKIGIHDIQHLDSWSSKSGKVILLGDAAHAVSPHSGQGASMALEDSLSLCRWFRDLQPESWGTVGGLFEAERKERVEWIVAAGRKAAEGKKKLGPTACWFRDKFFGYLGPWFISWQTKALYSYPIDWVNKPNPPKKSYTTTTTITICSVVALGCAYLFYNHKNSN